MLHDNDGTPVFESRDIRVALEAIQAASSGSEPQSSEVKEKECAWWSCWWFGVARFFDRLLPGASAQAVPEVPPPCELLVPSWSCMETLDNLLNELLFRATNPGASPASADDYAKLEACRGFAAQFNKSGGRVGWSREAREGFKTRQCQ